MPICGIIAEYNPFHNGHMRHLALAKTQTSAEAVICVMSGHFVQRGEPAILRKQARTRAALLHGADIVLELPVPYATASAERFASAAVEIFSACGIVDTLCFGSESGDLSALTATARSLANESPAFQSRLQAALAAGHSFPAARDKAAEGTAFLTMPNDILGVEYIKAILRQNASITPHTIKREGSDYHDKAIIGTIASATAIRHALANNTTWSSAMPQSAAAILLSECDAHCAPITLDHFSQAFLYSLRTTPTEALACRADIAEGLENRILRCAEDHASLSAIATAVKTKRYTHTRIQRALLHILLQINAEDSAAPAPYIRVLGFRRDSEAILRQLYASATLPVVTNLKNARALLNDNAFRTLEIECRATDIYRTAAQSLGGRMNSEWHEPMVMV